MITPGSISAEQQPAFFSAQEKQAAGYVPRLPVYSSEEPLLYRAFIKFTLSSKSLNPLFTDAVYGTMAPDDGLRG